MGPGNLLFTEFQIICLDILEHLSRTRTKENVMVAAQPSKDTRGNGGDDTSLETSSATLPITLVD